LIAAAAAGDQVIIRKLLEQGADPEAADNGGRTAWNHAIRNGHTDAAKLLESPDRRE
jgi:ankyrin repeat protein